MKSSNILWGLVLILIGIIFGLNALDIADINIFFDGWWTLFIIVPCLTSMFESGVKRSNTIGLTIGSLLLLSSWNVVPEELVVPLLLVVIGGGLIFIRPWSDRND